VVGELLVVNLLRKCLVKSAFEYPDDEVQAEARKRHHRKAHPEDSASHHGIKDTINFRGDGNDGPKARVDEKEEEPYCDRPPDGSVGHRRPRGRLEERLAGDGDDGEGIDEVANKDKTAVTSAAINGVVATGEYRKPKDNDTVVDSEHAPYPEYFDVEQR